MRSDIVPGNTFPDYQLQDHTRTLRKLSELQGDDPMILTLARGNYCPKEHQQHLDLAAFYPKIAVGYTQIATISTDDHHTSQELRASVGAQWTFLSDPERTVQKDLDIQEYTDPENDPMIPHTLVLKPGLVIHRIYNGYWFWGRPSIAELWEDLRAVTSEIRPDWDLGAPGLRDAWWRAGAPDPIRWIVISMHGIPDWASEGEVRTAGVPFRTTDAEAQIVAVRQGLGITTLPCFIGDTDPLLVRVPGSDLHMYGTLWLLTQGDTRKTKRVRLFTEFVSHRLAGYAPLLAGLSISRD